MFNEKMYALGSTRSAIRELFEYGNKRKSEIGEKNVFDFSLGNPSVLPPEKVSQSVVKYLETTNIHGYTSAQGAADVRKVISDSINKRFNVDMSPNYIYMTCGAAASLAITLNALYEKDDEVIVFAPYFPEYKVFIEQSGAKIVVSVPNPKMSIDFDDLSKKISAHTKAVIINSPNNPSGVVYSEEVIKELTKLLFDKSKAYGKPIFLIADEPYRELVYGASVPYIMNYYDNSVVCYSYSKVISLPGERIGYIAVDPKADNAGSLYLSVCGAGRALGYVCAPSLFQRVVKDCVEDSSDITFYKKNIELLYGKLVEIGYDCVKPEGAFYLFVKSPSGDGKELSERALKYELLLVPSDSFGLKGYIRIAYCVSYEVIKNSLSAFEKLFESYKKSV